MYMYRTGFEPKAVGPNELEREHPELNKGETNNGVYGIQSVYTIRMYGEVHTRYERRFDF